MFCFDRHSVCCGRGWRGCRGRGSSSEFEPVSPSRSPPSRRSVELKQFGRWRTVVDVVVDVSVVVAAAAAVVSVIVVVDAVVAVKASIGRVTWARCRSERSESWSRRWWRNRIRSCPSRTRSSGQAREVRVAAGPVARHAGTQTRSRLKK